MGMKGQERREATRGGNAWQRRKETHRSGSANGGARECDDEHDDGAEQQQTQNEFASIQTRAFNPRNVGPPYMYHPGPVLPASPSRLSRHFERDPLVFADVLFEFSFVPICSISSLTTGAWRHLGFG